jgi:hypothetical protein
MRLALKLILFGTLAIAATALAVPPTLAQTEPLAHHTVPGVQIRGEPTGTPCPAVTINPSRTIAAGGCVVHLGGPNLVQFAHVFGIESVQSTCNMEVDLRIDADGEGFYTHQEITPAPQGTCTRRPCGSLATGEGRPWEFSVRETGPVSPPLGMTLLFCLETFNPGPPVWHSNDPTHCEVDLAMIESTNHRYRLGSSTVDADGHGQPDFRCEFRGVLNIEATQVGPSGEGQSRTQVEVNHL